MANLVASFYGDESVCSFLSFFIRRFVYYVHQEISIYKIGNEFWNIMQLKLEKFYHGCLLLELVDPRNNRSIPLREPQWILCRVHIGNMSPATSLNFTISMIIIVKFIEVVARHVASVDPALDAQNLNKIYYK
jgi:hypothetical protein